MRLKSKETPGWLKALGREGLPDTIEHDGEIYRLEREFKHDFFAATGKYFGESGRAVVVKMGRRASLCFVPLSWIGRLLTGHEGRCLDALDDIEIVPRYLGRVGPNGLVHEYVEGQNLRQVKSRVPDDFFNRLHSGLKEIHDRDRAYVDMEKRENVIVGADGKPYLCDFQISWNWPARYGGNLWPLRRLRHIFQQADLYHVRKLQRLARPDQLSPSELKAAFRRPGWIVWHGRLTRPLTRLRRFLLARIDPMDHRRRGERGTIEQTEQRLRTGS